MKFSQFVYALLSICSALFSVSVRANQAPPANARWIDVTQPPYNALPNSGVDATAAIQQAIDDATINMPDPNGWSTFLHYRRIVYLPDGEYVISAPLVIRDVQNNRSRGYGLTLQGQSREGVTLRLTDNNPLFQDPAQPRAVFSTTQYEPHTAWGTNIAFKINVFDLTVDTGSGNPGAAGLRYIVNNQGSVRNVHIRSSDPEGAGWAGIDMETWSIGGPALITRVTIDGFDWGIRYGGTGHYSMVGEHITLNGQRVGGIRNQGQVFSLRRLITTQQAGPSVALYNVPGAFQNPGLVTLLDAELSGQGPAAVVVHENAGRVFLRDIEIAGYAHTLNDQGEMVTSVSQADYASGGGLTLWDEDFAPLRLPVLETPLPPPETEDRALWVDVTNHDGNGPYFTPGSQTNPTWGTTNHSARLQTAIDWAAANGRTTIYFPFGEYAIGTTLRIHGSVRRIVGNYAVFRPTMDARNLVDHPVIVFEDLDGSLFVEQINLYPGNQQKGIFFVNRSAHDVTIRNAYIGEGKFYLNDGAAGRLFLEDVAGLSSRYSGGVIHGHEPQFDFGAQQVWARQFNTEQDGVKVSIDGGQFWVLGFKTEEPGTVVRAVNGARVEVLGGLLLPSFTDDPDGGNALINPAFVFENSAATVSMTTHSPNLNGVQRPYYANIVRSARHDETRELNWAQTPTRRLAGSDRSVTLLLSLAANEPGIEPFARINFQPEGPAPAGWLVDNGAFFGDRGNGLAYGWTVDVSHTARQRNSADAPDLRHDTLIHMQTTPGNPVWQIAVPNGWYRVRIAAGDPTSLDSHYRINTGEVLTVYGSPDFEQRWVIGEGLVQVSDGFLRISNAPEAVNNKICWIEIDEVLQMPPGYAFWSLQLPAGERGKLDGTDGVPNLLRYALGGAPDQPVSRFRLQGQALTSGMQLNFPRIADANVVYEIWASEDLEDWGTQPVWSGTGQGPDALWLENPPPQWFLHLRVRYQTP